MRLGFDRIRLLHSARGFALAATAVLGLVAGRVEASTVPPFPTGSFTVAYQSSGAFGANAHATVQITGPGKVSAGGFALKVAGLANSAFTAFCLDIAHSLRTGTKYTAVQPNPSDNVFDTRTGAVGVNASQQGSIQKLFDAFYSSAILTDATKSAAFQLALWEIVDETKKYGGQIVFDANGADAHRGNFYAYSTSASIVTQANAYLSGMQSYAGPKRYAMTYLQSDVTCTGRSCKCTQGSQNLVTVSAVPVPAAGIMLLTAFGGLGGIAARRRRQQAA